MCAPSMHTNFSAPFPFKPCNASTEYPLTEMCTPRVRSEEHTSELQSLMRNSYAVFCLKKKNNIINKKVHNKNKTKTYNTKHQTLNYNANVTIRPDRQKQTTNHYRIRLDQKQ